MFLRLYQRNIIDKMMSMIRFNIYFRFDINTLLSKRRVRLDLYMYESDRYAGNRWYIPIVW